MTTETEMIAEVERKLAKRKFARLIDEAADKVLFSARKTAREAAREAAADPANRDKPRDQILVEAFQAEFRRNPEIAHAWQWAPGSESGK